MITEDYVSFETAKLLKEKEFNVPCLNYYDSTKTIRTSYDYCGVEGVWANFNEINDVMYSAPTLQMAIKWLREVHEIFIRPNISFLYRIKYYCEIFCYGDNLKTQQDVTTETFESPEEAYEEAIKYCLKNLI